jgi:general L-amino acid transport system permease protein
MTGDGIRTRQPRLRACLGWLRRNAFSGWASSIVTVLLLVLCGWALKAILSWGVVHAVFGGANVAACRAVEGTGACWAMIAEKFRLILFGLYPYEEQWRPAVCLVIMVGLYVVSGLRMFWRPALAAIWAVALACVALLMWGGVPGLPFVHDDRWGGLPVTLFIATFGLMFAFPLAVLLALARRATAMRGLKAASSIYIELVRGIPMVTVLFMASVMFPLFLPEGVNFSKLLRVLVAFTAFAAAYLAEVIRAGLQALPKGQQEAAASLGLSYWKMTLLVLLPQALRLVIPSIVNNFIGFFKATSVVTIVGIFDLLTSAKRAIADPLWQGFGTEVYLFVAAIYFVFCFSMSRYSRSLERRLSRNSRA